MPIGHLQLLHPNPQPAFIYLDPQVVVTRSRILVLVISSSFDHVRSSSRPAAHNVGHTIALVTFVVMDVTSDHHKLRRSDLLLVVQPPPKRNLSRTLRVSSARQMVHRPRHRWMMHQEYDKVRCLPEMFHFVFDPVELWTRSRRQGTIQTQNQHVPRANRVVAILSQGRKTTEIFLQQRIAMDVMISRSWNDHDLLRRPLRSFAVPLLPVALTGATQDQVSVHADETRIYLRDCMNDRLPSLRITD